MGTLGRAKSVQSVYSAGSAQASLHHASTRTLKSQAGRIHQAQSKRSATDFTGSQHRRDSLRGNSFMLFRGQMRVLTSRSPVRLYNTLLTSTTRANSFLTTQSSRNTRRSSGLRSRFQVSDLASSARLEAHNTKVKGRTSAKRPGSHDFIRRRFLPLLSGT